MQGTTPRFDARDYFRIIQKRKWFIILVGLAAMLVGGLYAVSYPKIYRANSLLIVRQRPAGVVWLSGPESRMGGSELGIDTLASMVTSGELATKVALSLRERKSGSRIVTDATEVQAALVAEPLPPDRIRIEAHSSMQENAIAFANEAAEQFILMNTDFRRQQDRTAREYLEDQLAKTDEELKRNQQELTDYENAQNIFSEDAGAGGLATALSSFKASRMSLDAELAAVRAQIGAVNALLSRERSDASRDSAVPNPAITGLQSQLGSAQVALAELRARYTDEHPAVQQLQARIKSLSEQIAATPPTISVPFGSLSNSSSALAMQLNALQIREADVVARIASVDRTLQGLTAESRALPAKLAGVVELRSRTDLLIETRKRLMQELETRRLEEEAKGGTARIMDRAMRASSMSPPVSRALLFAGVLGLVIGVALSLLLEALDDTIHTPEDIARESEAAFLGMVPLLDSALEELITISAPKSPPAESYRTVRSNINFSMVDNPSRRFLLTSAGAGEGKSVTAANLAVVFAQAGQSVILVDTDLRRPSLHRLLHCESSRGLTNVLVGESEIEDVLQDTHVEGLRLLASGPLPPNPAEMLDSAPMQRLIDALPKHADVVIFDSPPAIVLTDAVVMSSKIEHTILVAESGQVTREAFREALRLIDNARGKVLGVVLNKLRLSASDYYYYYYYYDYSRETPRVITPAPPSDAD